MDDQTDMDTGFAQKCADTTKKICILTIITAIMIIIFMFSPVSNLLVAASLGKVAIVLILAYIIYVNVLQTVFCQQVFNVNFFNLDLNQAKINTIGGHIFTIALIVLLYSVVTNLLRPLFGGGSTEPTQPPPQSSFMSSGYN
jgi:hypothetical protein